MSTMQAGVGLQEKTFDVIDGDVTVVHRRLTPQDKTVSNLS